MDQTISSIVKQIDADLIDIVEICISDNASQDNTEQVVQKWQKNTENSIKIVFSRNEVNLGADNNYLRAVSLASGDYCWLFGSDDAMYPNALKLVLMHLKNDPAIILGNRMVCNEFLLPMHIQKWCKNSKKTRVIDFSIEDAVLEYLKSAKHLGAIFSYLSTIVVKRKFWDDVIMDPAFIGGAYSHVFKLMSILLEGRELLYLDKVVVSCRTGNDSFMSNGLVSRVLLDFDGYETLAEKLLSDRPFVKKEFLNVLTREHSGFTSLVKVFSVINQDSDRDSFRARLKSLGFNSTIVSLALLVGKSSLLKFTLTRDVLHFLLKKYRIGLGKIKRFSGEDI